MDDLMSSLNVSKKDPEAYTKASVSDVCEILRYEIQRRDGEISMLVAQVKDLQNRVSSYEIGSDGFVSANSRPKVYSSWGRLEDIGDRDTLAQIVGSTDVYEWDEDEGWHVHGRRKEIRET